MKKTFFLFIVISSVFCKSQTNRFIYELQYRNNSSEDYRKNLMALDINPTSTKISDYDFIKYDSINKNAGESRSRYSTKTDQIIVRQPNSFKNERYRDFFDYFVEKTNDEMKWKLFPDTQLYNEYKLQKATTEFGGRKWIAWFSNDVNISEGPYKFSGLPGLIVEIYDEEKNHEFSLIEVKKNKNAELHDFSKKEKEITQMQLNKLIDGGYKDTNANIKEMHISSGNYTFLLNDGNILKIRKDIKNLDNELSKQMRRMTNSIEIEKPAN